MEQWVINKAFELYDFETALDVCFAAASCEVENMINERIYFYNTLNSIRDRFIPCEKFNYKIRWSTPKGVFDNKLI